jgi:acetoacetate decarboxylase
MGTEKSTGGLFLPHSDGSQPLTEALVRKNGYSMPYHSPSYAPPPNAFLDRPALTVTYRTDIDLVRQIVPEPLVVKDPLVSLTFLYMVAPGIGDYYEFSQSIPCFLGDEAVVFRPLMATDNVTAILAGREILGLPKKYGRPRLEQIKSSYVGTLEIDGTLVAGASMAYKFKEMDTQQAQKELAVPTVVLKMIPDIDGSIRIAELVRFTYSVTLKGAWTGPGSVDLFHHAAAPLAALPVRDVVSVTHTYSDSWIEDATVVHDYTKKVS